MLPICEVIIFYYIWIGFWPDTSKRIVSNLSPYNTTAVSTLNNYDPENYTNHVDEVKMSRLKWNCLTIDTESNFAQLDR